MTERSFPIAIDDMRLDLEEEMHPFWRPLHLLLLDHPFTYHLIDGGLDQAGADSLTVPISLIIIDDRARIVRDVCAELAFYSVTDNVTD